ncbi:MAG: uroporphyrinogen-III synthase, partial [Planctomycetaceae bacterium]|nr:uroporphyrinogen-III synthase [Planctomycetaceae bacterium]
VGAEALLQLADVRGCQPELIAALKMMTVIARGPKPVAVLHRYGIECDLKAPEPNTWREVLTVMEQSGMSFSGSNLAVQEYGVPNPRFNDALTARGVHVVPVPVYRWALPDDIGPLNAAIDQVIQAQIDVLMFTSANQVATVLQIAEGRGLRNQFCQAAAQCLVASVGPTCSEMLSDMGFVVGFEASPPKMGPLVRGAVETWTQLRQAEQ